MRKQRERELVDSLSDKQNLSAIATDQKLAEIAAAEWTTQDYLMRALLWRSSEHQKQEDEELLESAIAMFEKNLVCKFEGYRSYRRYYRGYWKFLLLQQPAINGTAKLEIIDPVFFQGRIVSLLDTDLRNFDLDEAGYIIHLLQDEKFWNYGIFGEATEVAMETPAFRDGTLRRELELSQQTLSGGYKQIMGELFGNSLARYRQIAIRQSMRVVKEAHVDDDAIQRFVKGEVSQEFLESDSGGVSAILFKYGRPFSTARVVHHDLSAMGWNRILKGSISQPCYRYWRYERGRDDKTRNFVFKVDMDGAIMDIWDPLKAPVAGELEGESWSNLGSELT